MMKKEQEAPNEMIYGLLERGLSIGPWRHMLWICAQNSVDKHNVLAIAAQCLQAFLFPTLSPTAIRLRLGKRLRGFAAGTADCSDQRGIPY